MSRRGYDAVQVDDYLRHLDARLRMLAADRDAAVEQNGQLTRQVNVAWAETDRLKGQLRRLSAPPESVEGMSERLQSMLRLAQDEVAERRKRAEAEATEIVARAEAEAGELPRQNEAIRRQLEHERKQLTFERNKILTEAREEADLIRGRAAADGDRMRAEATAETDALRQQSDEERRTLDAQSAAKRVQVEEDFDIAMSSRRAEAMATIHRNQAASREEANGLLTNARAEAERKLADAQRAVDAAARAAELRVAETETLRAHMASQLVQLRGVLDDALPALTGAAGQLPSSSVGHRDGHNDGAQRGLSNGVTSANGDTVHTERQADSSSTAGSEQHAVSDPTPTPRSSPEVRPSPQRRRPAPAGQQR